MRLFTVAFGKELIEGAYNEALDVWAAYLRPAALLTAIAVPLGYFSLLRKSVDRTAADTSMAGGAKASQAGRGRMREWFDHIRRQANGEQESATSHR